MSRKTAFIIILVVISLLVGGLVGFYFYSKNKNQAPTILGRDTTGKTFGGYDPGAKNQSGNQESELVVPGKTDDTKIPRLREISKAPVAGADFVSLPVYATSSKNIEPADTSLTGGKVTPVAKPKLIGYNNVIRFIERATGHIYETSTSSKTNIRISNTTIPKIYQAYFTEKGDSLILRDLVGNTDVIRTRYAKLVFSTTTDSEKSLVTSDLPTGILQSVQSPNRDQIFSILSDGITGYTSTPDGGSKQSILDIPFREWLADWPESKTILLTTKPSGFYPGFAYTLNPTTKALNRVLGDINGLTTLMSPDASKILFSKSLSGVFKLGIVDIKTGVQRDLPFRTFPEKCVWSKTEKNTLFCAAPEDVAFNVYPDVWYQGNIAFSDSIWKINVETGETRLFSKLAEESGQILDIQSISINSDDDYLIFVDKNTLHLWGLRLKEPPRELFDILKADTSTSTKTATTTVR